MFAPACGTHKFRTPYYSVTVNGLENCGDFTPEMELPTYEGCISVGEFSYRAACDGVDVEWFSYAAVDCSVRRTAWVAVLAGSVARLSGAHYACLRLLNACNVVLSCDARRMNK